MGIVWLPGIRFPLRWTMPSVGLSDVSGLWRSGMWWWRETPQGEIWHWFSAISSKRREGSSRDGWCVSPWTDMTASGRSYTQRAEMDPTITMDYIQAVRKSTRGEGI